MKKLPDDIPLVTEARCDCGAKRGDPHLPACPHLIPAPPSKYQDYVTKLGKLPVEQQLRHAKEFCRSLRGDELGLFMNDPAVVKWMEANIKAILASATADLSKYYVADMKGNLIPDDVVAGVTPPGKWDLKDEDGVAHSPSWYLSGFISSERDYHEALAMDTRTMTEQEQDEHMLELDLRLDELDKFSTYVNMLFGSEIVEGPTE